MGQLAGRVDELGFEMGQIGQLTGRVEELGFEMSPFVLTASSLVVLRSEMGLRFESGQLG